MEVLTGLGPPWVSSANTIDEGFGASRGWCSAGDRANSCPTYLQPNLLKHTHQQLVHVVLDAARGLDELALPRSSQTFALC